MTTEVGSMRVKPTALVAFLALVLVIGLGRWKLARTAAGDEPRTEATSLSEDKDHGSLQLEAPSSRTSHGEAREFIPPSTASPVESKTELVVAVLWEDATPAVGVNVGICPSAGGPSSWLSKTVTDDAGTARFGVPAGTYSVGVDRMSSLITEVAERETRTLKITIPRGNDVEGVVLAEDGATCADAEILLYDVKSGLSPTVVARSDPFGRFVIRSLRLGMAELCAAKGMHVASPRVRLQSTSPGYAHRIRLVLGARGGNMGGQVVDTSGIGIARAWVIVGDWPLDDDATPQPDGTELAPVIPRGVLANEEGKFSAVGLAPGPQSIRVRADGYGLLTSVVRVPAERTGDCQVVLEPEIVVAGTVRDRAGEPVDGAEVYMRARDEQVVGLACDLVSCLSGADGAFRLSGLPSGSLELVAVKGRSKAPTLVNELPGTVVAWNPVLDLGERISGRLVVPGECDQEFFIACRNLDSPEMQTLRLEKAGDFSFFSLMPGKYRVFVRSVASGIDMTHEDVAAGETALELHLECDQMPSIRLGGQIARRQGAAGELRIVPRGPGLENYTEWRRTRPDGTFDLGPYFPGEWWIEVRKGKTKDVLLKTPAVFVSPGESFDFGLLEIE